MAKNEGLRAILLSWCVVIAMAIFSLYRFSPPPIVADTAAATEFSAERALKHLKVIAERPHPVGSEGHHKVKTYLLEQLTILGLRPELQVVSSALNSFGLVSGARVENIVARLPGRSSTKAVALFAHYDSVPESRGASDDGAGVVTLLETARALLASNPLENDVMFIFTDAEENGLLGAHAFVTKHPWAHEIGLFLNFEARGSSGPSMMFRTSSQNRELIKGFAQAAPFPVTSSLGSSLSTILPNDTDFTVLTKWGLSGYDFAYARGLEHYHQYLDSVEMLDQRSLQHHGSYALSLTRHFGNVDLKTPALSTSDFVYFDLFGWFVVYYPELVATILGVANLLLFCLFFWRKKIMRSAAINVGAVVLCALSVFLLRSAFGLFRDSSFFISHAGVMMASFLLVSFALFFATYLLAEKQHTTEEAWAGALLPFIFAGLVAGIFLPGASFIFHWPALFSMVAFWLEQRGSSFGGYAKLIAVVPATTIFTGLCFMVFILESGNAPVATAAAFGLTLSFLVPLVASMPRLWKKRIVLACLTLGLAVSIVAMGSISYSRTQPLQVTLNYGLDANTGRASFVTFSPDAEAWSSPQLSFTEASSLPTFYSRTMKAWQAAAPTIALTPPELRVLEHRFDPSRGLHVIKLEASSPRGAECVGLWEESPSVLQELWINNEKIPSVARFSPDLDKKIADTMLGAPLRSWEAWYCNPPKTGVTIEAHLVPAAEPLKLRVVDESYGLPAALERPRMRDNFATSVSSRTRVSASHSFALEK